VLRFTSMLFSLFLLPLVAQAEGRLALLIGNQDYGEKVGPAQESAQ